MPCRDYRDDYKVEYRDNPNYELAKSRLDEVTALLCATMERLEDVGFDIAFEFRLQPEVLKWWENHKKEDAEARRQEGERQAEEARRQAVIDKFNELFTEEEQWELRNTL